MIYTGAHIHPCSIQSLQKIIEIQSMKFSSLLQQLGTESKLQTNFPLVYFFNVFFLYSVSGKLLGKCSKLPAIDKMALINTMIILKLAQGLIW